MQSFFLRWLEESGAKTWLRSTILKAGEQTCTRTSDGAALNTAYGAPWSAWHHIKVISGTLRNSTFSRWATKHTTNELSISLIGLCFFDQAVEVAARILALPASGICVLNQCAGILFWKFSNMLVERYTSGIEKSFEAARDTS